VARRETDHTVTLLRRLQFYSRVAELEMKRGVAVRYRDDVAIRHIDRTLDKLEGQSQ